MTKALMQLEDLELDEDAIHEAIQQIKEERLASKEAKREDEDAEVSSKVLS